MRIVLILFSSYLLVSSSTLGPFSFLPRFDQNEHSAWNDRCGISDVDRYSFCFIFFSYNHNLLVEYSIIATLLGPKSNIGAFVLCWLACYILRKFYKKHLFSVANTSVGSLPFTIRRHKREDEPTSFDKKILLQLYRCRRYHTEICRRSYSSRLGQVFCQLL